MSASPNRRTIDRSSKKQPTRQESIQPVRSVERTKSFALNRKKSKLPPITAEAEEKRKRIVKTVTQVKAGAIQAENPKDFICRGIEAIISGKSAEVSFSKVYDCVTKVKSPQDIKFIVNCTLSLLGEFLHNQIFARIESMVEIWDSYCDLVNKCALILKYLDYTPNRRASKHRIGGSKPLTQLAIENQSNLIWERRIKEVIESSFVEEIRNFLKQLASPGNEIPSYTNQFFRLYNRVNSTILLDIIDLAKSHFNKRASSSKLAENAEYLINETRRLSHIIPIEVIQKEYLLPGIEFIIPELIRTRDEHFMVFFGSFIHVSLLQSFSALIEREMKKINLPIDFFSLSAFYNYFSTVFPVDNPSHSLVKSAINKSDADFPDQFISVLYAHRDYPQNIKSLLSLGALYENHEELQSELLKNVIIHILSSDTEEIEGEIAFIQSLNVVLPSSIIQVAANMCSEVFWIENCIVFNSLYWKISSLPVDHLFPDDLFIQVKPAIDLYLKQNPKRNVVISAVFSKVEIGYLSRKLIVSALQWNILTMIQNKSLLLNGYPERATKSAISTLMKAGVIRKSSNGYLLEENLPKAKKINIYKAAIKISTKITPRTFKSDDRTHEIQSKIVLIAKKHKIISISELKQKILENVDTNEKTIDTAIEKLQKLDILKREADSLHYVT